MHARNLCEVRILLTARRSSDRRAFKGDPSGLISAIGILAPLSRQRSRMHLVCAKFAHVRNFPSQGPIQYPANLTLLIDPEFAAGECRN